MAYRMRMISEIKYGQFGAWVKTWQKLDSIMQERGWAPGRLLVPTAGANNQVIVEFEYPDLATFERENRAFYSDEKAFKAYRAGAEFVIEGSSRTELLEDVPMDVFSSD